MRQGAIYNKKLNAYTIAAGCLLYLHQNASSQVIYTDLDPDLILDDQDEQGFIDLDNNGIFDFAFSRAFSHFTNATYSSLPGDSYSRTVIWAGWSGSPNNEIAGSYIIGPFGSWTRYYPYALGAGEVIKEIGIGGLSFQNWGFQRMAFKSYKNGGIFWNDGGNWFPEEVDQYLGVKFIDNDDEFHFGWIRCSVIDSGEVLTIKDYAYEIKPETGILAGDTIGDTTTIAIEEINLLQADVYSFNNSIFINLNELMKGVEIHIYDPNGEMIYSDEIRDQSTQIELNKAKGVYFVELISGEKKFRKKVYLN